MTWPGPKDEVRYIGAGCAWAERALCHFFGLVGANNTDKRTLNYCWILGPIL